MSSSNSLKIYIVRAYIRVANRAGVDWRQKLENQRGAVLATELKNNGNKLAKWTAAALISGTDMIKLGYVSRATHRDNTHHVILGTQARFPPVCHWGQRSSVSIWVSRTLIKFSLQ